MSIHPIHRLRRSAAGVALGFVALVLVAAVLGGSAAAFRASSTIDSLAGDLHAARVEITGLRADNARLIRRDTVRRQQLAYIVRFLDRHGLQVPDRPTPQTGVTPTPKAPTVPGNTSPTARPSPKPRHHHPSGSTGGPTATPPTPGPTTAPDPLLGVLCDLAPTLCPEG
jgi:hypothetical protein